MSPPSSNDLAQVILRSATENYYPDSDIADANLEDADLQAVIEELRKAKEAVKEEVRQTSRTHAPELDSWINQSRQLHADIEASKAQADEILALAQQDETLSAAVRDAEAQCAFLASEIRFSTDLASLLGKLHLIEQTLTSLTSLLSAGALDVAVHTLKSAEEALQMLQDVDEIIVVGLMKERARDLRAELVARVDEVWGGLVTTSAGFEIREKVKMRDGVEVELEAAVTALEVLGSLQKKVDTLHTAIDRQLLTPCLSTENPTHISLSDNTIVLADQHQPLDADRMFSDLLLIIRYLRDRLPSEAAKVLSRTLIPHLRSRLITIRLASSVPARLEDLGAFEELLEKTRAFEESLRETGWTSGRELSEWVERAPRVWLGKRLEDCLESVREVMGRGIGETRVVERSETGRVGGG